MTASDLIERLALTTYLDFDQASKLVCRGILCGLLVRDMAQFGESLPTAIECAAMGVTTKQLLGWKEHLSLLHRPTNYREAHAALCSAVRSYGDERAAAERRMLADILHNYRTDAARRGITLLSIDALDGFIEALRKP